MGRLAMGLPGAAELAQQGYTASQIARELHVALWAVRYWATTNDITLAKYRHSLKPAAERAIALAKEGLYPTEIARQCGLTRAGVVAILAREGVAPGKYTRERIEHAPKPRAGMSPENIARAEKMESMYRQGLTLEKIGQHFGGITRERVRQILGKRGIIRADNLRSKKTDTVEAARKARMEAASLARLGIPYEEKKRRCADGTLTAFRSQRHTASARGIAWNLLFSEWLAIWETSGKLHLRGRGTGHYVMSRIKDDGGYVMGNVHIQPATDNNREGIAKCRYNKAAHPGVWYIYPGLAKPWLVKVGRDVNLGTFATEEEGAAARREYLAQHPERPGVRRGLGYTMVNKGKAPRYRVEIADRYIGTFSTAEAALTARAAALEPA